MSSKVLSATVLAALMAAPLAVNADTAPGEQKGDWIVRGGFHQLNPDSDNVKPFPNDCNTVTGAGCNTLVVDDDVSFTADGTYMFSNHFGVELLVAYPFTHGIDIRPYSGGKTRIGSVDVLPPTLSLVWRPGSYHAAVQPYLGAGVTYALFSGEHVYGSRGDCSGAELLIGCGTRFNIDDEIGFSGVVGVDFFPGEAKKWFFNVNARYIDLTPTAEFTRRVDVTPAATERLGKTKIDLNPMAYGVMLGRRFGAPKPAPVAEPPPPPPPPPPPAAAPTKCADGDMDGVCDVDDKCPNTPAGTKVDKVGCPLEQTLKLLFDFDSAELRPESIEELERVVKFMGDVPFATALIEGHTDSIGSDAYNLALSDRRAKSVFDYLTSRGVDPARLSSVGKGETMPIADNSTAEGRQQNRRVMLIRTDSGM